jgi:hypothetical protein
MMFNDGRVISNFIVQALLGEDITVHGQGAQSRSFMYISDLVEAFMKLMAVPAEKIGIGPVNLGNPDERTIISLAEDIKRASGSQSRIVYMEYDKILDRAGDPQRRCPDIAKARGLIDWSPQVSFTEGLEITIADFKKRLDHKTKIIIFAPIYFPSAGPAERIVAEITNRLIGYDFDIVTARFKPDLNKTETIGRVNVHRLGFGAKLDKYLLPLLAFFKARSLHKENNYQAAWGIMASYGALGTLLFSFFYRVGCLVSLYEGGMDHNEDAKHRFLSPFYKIIYHRAHRLQIIAELTQTQIAWLEDDKNLRPVDLDKGWDYAAKKTKEEFQELEILTSRL